MNDKAKLYFSQLPEENQREFRLIFETDATANGMRTRINFLATKGQFYVMGVEQTRLSKYEDELFARYYERHVRNSPVTMTKVYDTIPGDADKARFAMLANKSVMLINLLDNAYQDLTSVMAKHGYAPQTVEQMAKAGEAMKVAMRRIFGELPEAFADDLDDCCTEIDKLISNKVGKFLRVQREKQRRT